MSQPDLIAQLREHRPVAPDELRERVRLVYAEARVEERVLRRRIVWRRVLVVAIAVAALAVAAGTLLPRGDDRPTAQGLERVGRAPGVLGTLQSGTEATDSQGALPKAPTKAAAPRYGFDTVPPPSQTNAQRYSATLSLRLKDAAAVSAATNKALRIVAAMGGHPNTVNVDAERRNGEAYLVLKVPRSRVQEAVQKLGALGTIVGANVSIQDLQADVDTTGRTIARLKDRLAELQAQPQTDDVVAQIETVSDRIETLQRNRAATIRAAQFATVKLHMETPEPAVPPAEEGSGAGPLHGLGVAFRWIGIGAVYALALGTPLVLLLALAWLLARGLRRRRNDALLSRA